MHLTPALILLTVVGGVQPYAGTDRGVPPVVDPASAQAWEDVGQRVTGTATPGATVLVQTSDDGTRWHTRAQTTADVNGRFAATLRSTTPRTWRLRAVTDDGASATSRLTFGDRVLTGSFLRDTSRAGVDPVRVRGHLSGPLRPEVRVLVSRNRGRLQVLRHLRPGRDGRFRMSWRPSRPGTYRLRLVAPGPQPPATFERSAAVADRLDVTYTFWSRVDRTVTASDLGASWSPGCPVGPAQLDNLQVTYRTFGAGTRVRTGTLVVDSDAVPRVRAAFRSGFRHHFPIRRIATAAAFDGNDYRMMAADITSVFNCRRTSGGSGLSPHSYGWAVDVNPRENPYLAANGVWYPRNGLTYRDRSNARPGMLYARSAITRALLGRGYQWGGFWGHRDWQHFDLRGSVARLIGAATYARGWRRGD